MKISQLLSVASVAVGAAFAQDAPRECGTTDPSAQQQRVLDAAAEPVIFDPNNPQRRPARINVDTYVHVVTTQAQAGRWTQAQVDEQMLYMNQYFEPYGFTFTTQNVTFTVNDAWSTNLNSNTPQEIEMKTALNQGGYDALNLYFVGSLRGGLLGWCWFPTTELSPLARIRDGCINAAGSLPQGGISNYQLGATAVHETGHWLGLYHTFQAAGQTVEERCAFSLNVGDLVDDTPAQHVPTSGCPRNDRPDSCPMYPGLDPIFNFMDYSTDECMVEFTPGQSERAVNIYNALRAGAIRFAEPVSLGDAAIAAPNRNCANEATYLGVRQWPGAEFDIERCAAHCRETSQFNSRTGRPACRFFNTYVQSLNGVPQAQYCAMYSQEWEPARATNRGQFNSRGRITISQSWSAVDADNDGTPDCQ